MELIQIPITMFIGFVNATKDQCGEGWILQFSMTWHAICVHSADECKHLKKLLGTSTIGHVSFVFDLGLLLGYLL